MTAAEGVRTFYNGYFDRQRTQQYDGDRAYLRAHRTGIRLLSAPGYSEQSPFGQAAKDELSNLGHYFARTARPYRMFTSNLNFLQCQGTRACQGAGIFGLLIYKVGDCVDDADCRSVGSARQKPGTGQMMYPLRSPNLIGMDSLRASGF